MTDADEQITYSFKEYKRVMDRIDEIARLEGTNRSSLIRRALRNLAFSSPIIPGFGEFPNDDEQGIAA